MTGVVEGDEEVEEEEVGERLAHREGRRRLAGRAGLEKFFWTEEEERQDSSFSWRETNELTFRMITPSCQKSDSHTQILYILSRVPSVVFLILGKTTGIFQTGTNRRNPGRSCEKITQADPIPIWSRGMHLNFSTLDVQQFPCHLPAFQKHHILFWTVLPVEAKLKWCL